MKKYMEFAVEKLPEIMSIDSPSGYTDNFIDYLMNEFKALGYSPVQTIKGSLIVDLGGKDADNGIVLSAHGDTLGGMVREIKSNGRLKITNIGGLNANNVEAENCRIVTKFKGTYTGCCQLTDASLHVNTAYNETSRTFETVEVLIDENVFCKEDVLKLGISPGDFVCFDPRTTVTESGYIKSRFLDDKLSVSTLLAYAKYLKDENIVPERKVFGYVTVYEEVGFGASTLPCDVVESLVIDMGCVGEGIDCNEHKVSICAKDSSGPYNYEVVTNLIKAAQKEGADYSVDIYPKYSSDVDATLKGGYEIKHGLIGAGVYASHGYERSHKDGVLNTLKLLKGYLG